MLEQEEKQHKPLRSYLWDTWDKSPEERKFLKTLDACLLTYAILSYFSKTLDLSNITNAYVSGMQEDLKLAGNDLNYITTAWTCGYIIGQIPSNLLITRIRPSIWIPSMELLWSVLTIILCTSKNATHLIVIRFFVGLAESTFFPGIQYVIGGWYKGDEIGKRSCIFTCANAIGPMFSGFLQTAAYARLNGVYGLPAWKWLFILDTVITLPIAILGFLIMPNLPHNTQPSFLYSESQLKLARKRMDEIGRKPPAKFTKAKVLNFFKTWHIYVLVPFFVLISDGCGVGASMIFWLQSFNTSENQVYTVGQINLYPLGINVVQVIATLVWAWWSDITRVRWAPIVVATIWTGAVFIALAVSPLYTHIAARWALYYMTMVAGCLFGLVIAWVNELNGHDSEKRAFMIAACNAAAYVVQAWFNIVFFPQVEQPRILKGTITSACMNFLIAALALMTYYLERRDNLARTHSSAAVTDIN